MVFGLKKKKNGCFHSIGGDDCSVDNDDFRPSPRGRQRESDNTTSPGSPIKPRRKDRSTSAVRKIVSAFTIQPEKSVDDEAEESGRPSVLPAPSGDLDLVSESPIRKQNRWRPRTPVRRKNHDDEEAHMFDEAPPNELPVLPQSEVETNKRIQPGPLRPMKSPLRGKMEVKTEQLRSPRKSPRKTRQTSRDDDCDSTMNGSVNSFASFGGNAFDWNTAQPKSPGRRSPLSRFRAKQTPPKSEEHQINHAEATNDDASISESVVFKRFEALEERRPSLLAGPSFADFNVDLSAESNTNQKNNEIQKKKPDHSLGSSTSMLGENILDENFETSETSSHFSEISGCNNKASRPNLRAVPSQQSLNAYQKPNLLSSTSYHGHNVRPPVTNNNRLRRGSNGSLPSILRTNSYSSKHTMDKIKKQTDAHKDKNEIDSQVNHQIFPCQALPQEFSESKQTSQVEKKPDNLEEPKHPEENKSNNVSDNLKSLSERRSRTCGASLHDDKDDMSVLVKSLVTPKSSRCKMKVNAASLPNCLEDGISSIKSLKDDVQKSKLSSRANRESSSVKSSSSADRERASRSSVARSQLSKSMHVQSRVQDKRSPRQATHLELHDRSSIHTSRPSKSPGTRSRMESSLETKSKECSGSQEKRTPTRRKKHEYEENPTTPVEKISRQSLEKSENYSTPSKRRSRSTETSSENTEKVSTPSRRHQSRSTNNTAENLEKASTPSRRRQSRTTENSPENPDSVATPSKRRPSRTADNIEKASTPSKRRQSRSTENVEHTPSNGRHSGARENVTPSTRRNSNATQNSETSSRKKENAPSKRTNEDSKSICVSEQEDENTGGIDVQLDESPTRRTTSFDARARKAFIEEMKRDLAKEPIKTEEPATPTKSPRLRLRGLKFPTGNRAPKSVEPLDIPCLEEKLASSLSAMDVDMSNTKSKGSRESRRPSSKAIARSISANPGVSGSEPIRMKVKIKKKSHAHEETDNAMSGIAQFKLPSENAAFKVEQH